MTAMEFAPAFVVPDREIAAVEHPMVVKNIENGLKTFGKAQPFREMIDDENPNSSLPLYLRPGDPSCVPILSHNTPTNNVLLKITVPRRTGRKRKKGSQDPYTVYSPESEESQPVLVETDEAASLRSHSRLDNPRELLRTLKDTVGLYHVEAVGTIQQTHRYRGMADFHYSTNGPFMTKFKESLLDGSLESMKKFRFDPSRGVKPNEELIPPPTLTDKHIPFNWNYAQNPFIKITSDPETGRKILLHKGKPKLVHTIYLAHDHDPIPTEPHSPPSSDSTILLETVSLIKAVLSDRPIISRRALSNHLAATSPTHLPHLKFAIQYAGYQFRGGPWRDAVIRFGIDPRLIPSLRKYQTLFFKPQPQGPGISTVQIKSPSKRKAKAKLSSDEEDNEEANSNSDSDDSTASSPSKSSSSPTSHLFDGTTLSTDGAIWQLCDITDPILTPLVHSPAIRSTCDIDTDGWYHNGTMAKIKAIMRSKISAIQAGVAAGADLYERALAVPDEVVGRRGVAVPVPEWRDGVEVVRRRERGQRRRIGLGRARKGGEVLGVRVYLPEKAKEKGKGKEKEVADGGGEEQTVPTADTPTPVEVVDEEVDDDDDEGQGGDPQNPLSIDGSSSEEEQREDDSDIDVDIDTDEHANSPAYDSDGVPIE